MKTLLSTITILLFTSCSEQCMVIEKQKYRINSQQYMYDTIFLYKVKSLETGNTTYYETQLRLRIGEIVNNGI